MSDKKVGKTNLPDFIKAHEVLVNLEKYWVKRRKAKRKRKKFERRFSGQGQKKLKNIRDVMPMKDLKEYLWKGAHDEAKNLPDKNEFITGMRVFMGMKNDHTLQLIYRSEYVKRKPNNPHRKFEGIATPVKNAKYYHELRGNLVVLDETLAKEAKGRYKKSILINRNGLGQWEGYDDGDKDYHDTKSIFFSFQEIFALYHKGYKCPIKNCKYEGLMAISSASRLKSRIPGNLIFRRAKHVLVISARNGEKFLNIGPAEDDDGNLGHVCPPATDCVDIDYEI